MYDVQTTKQFDKKFQEMLEKGIAIQNSYGSYRHSSRNRFPPNAISPP